MKIIGRKRERDELNQCILSKRPEFVAVYGRRRVGKTYLIKEFFNKQFAFYATGVSEKNTSGQLRAFKDSLIEYGCPNKNIPKNWYEAFSRLRKLLSADDVRREVSTGKRIVFLDEVPWMDTARSDFKSALDFFWNSWASSEEDMLLIVCGSATSWIIDNLLEGTKGFHNRVTRRIRLLPFDLKECRDLLQHNGMEIPEDQIIDCYMAMGGVPFYLNMLDPRLSIAQNINELCFKEYGALYNEYDYLFYSLFKKPEKHMAILAALSSKEYGLTRNQLILIPAIGGGTALTKALKELEQCGFIRKYSNYTVKGREQYYQLVDPFVLFSLRFINDRNKSSWMEFINTPQYNSWKGKAFEMVLFNHVTQIKTSLGINGVESVEYSWRSETSAPGAQIDLLIDRNDGVINLCEAKYSCNEYEIKKDEYEKIKNRLAVFQNETGCRKSIHITLITVNGLKNNKYSGIAQNVISGEDLFIM